MQIDLTARGFKEMYSALDHLAVEVPKVGLRQMRSALVRARDKARKYPGKPAGSKYKRTRTYFKSFAVVKISDGWSLQSDAIDPRGRAYTVYVGGDESGGGQSYNTTHWPIIKNQVDAEIGPLTADLNSVMQVVVNTIFGRGGP